jgi:hypothetical protein
MRRLALASAEREPVTVVETVRKTGINEPIYSFFIHAFADIHQIRQPAGKPNPGMLLGIDIFCHGNHAH